MSKLGDVEAYCTQDLAIASYVYMQEGVKLLEWEVVSGNIKRFRFNISKKEGEILSIKYANSKCRRFNDAMRTLKKVIHP